MSATSSRPPDLARERVTPDRATVRPWRHAPAGLLVDVTMGVFVVAMLGVMLTHPGDEAAPFHLIFLALAIAYAYRIWPVLPTVLVIVAVTVPGGWLMASHASEGALAKAELVEIPLLPLLVLAMVWHGRRRFAAQRETEAMAARQLAGVEREREFVSNASHAIRTPVTIARGHLEVASERELSDDTQADLSVATQQLDRLSALASRLLALSQLDATGPVRRRPTDLAELVLDLGDNWSLSADRDWTVRVEPTGTILADPDWIGLSVDALIENAVHYTPPGGAIGLTCTVTTAAECRITVADTGAGIPPEDLPFVFDRFWHREPPHGPMGTGLGLSMAKAVAVAHGGSLTAANRPSGGAVFELRLPLARPAGANDE
jgi:signal transduction histidine kinase